MYIVQLNALKTEIDSNYASSLMWIELVIIIRISIDRIFETFILHGWSCEVLCLYSEIVRIHLCINYGLKSTNYGLIERTVSRNRNQNLKIKIQIEINT